MQIKPPSVDALRAERNGTPQRSPAARDSGVPTSSTPSSVESVDLSPGSLSARALNTAPVDTARVESLRSAIASGQFQVDARQVADRMIATERELLTSQR